MNSNKSRIELNWEDRMDINTGIKRTIYCIKKNLTRINKLPLKYIHKK